MHYHRTGERYVKDGRGDDLGWLVIIMLTIVLVLTLRALGVTP
jgi:hypothetical protein